MHIRYNVDPASHGYRSPSFQLDQPTQQIPWDQVTVGMLCIIGAGEFSAFYIVRDLNRDNITLSELYRRVAPVQIPKARLNQVRPVVFITIPSVRETKPVVPGTLYQVYPTGTLVIARQRNAWLTAVDRCPIFLPVIARLVIRRTPNQPQGEQVQTAPEV